jgi:hypothetical protein
VRVDPLLGARLLLVPPPAAEGGREAVLLDGVEEGGGLHPVARGLAVVDDDAVGDRVVDARDHQADTQPVDPVVPGLHHFGEVETGVDLQDRERDLRREERLLREPQHHDGVLAAREHQDGLLELGGDLTEDVDRLRLQLVELTQPVVGMRLGHDGGKTSPRDEQPTS